MNKVIVSLFKPRKKSIMGHTATTLTFLLVLFTAVSCKTVPLKEEIPEGLTTAELSLMGQKALDKNNYKAAEIYYQTIIDRYSNDMGAVTAAEYEIAHIRVKQKHWSSARPLLEQIIARYEMAGGAGLPPEYLVLARNDLEKVSEGESAATKKE